MSSFATRSLRLFNTVRHLKLVQVVGRARHRLLRPRPDMRPAPPRRAVPGSWEMPARRRQSLVGPSAFQLLNVSHDLDQVGWDSPDVPKLWRYNQHYFDDLCAVGSESRSGWHRALVSRWILENPAGSGTGWEPYPTSVRIANWVKWLLAGNEPPPRMLDSLAVQVRWLTGRLEWHLLGNHLFVNAKALVHAGAFFEGPEAERWLLQGTQILREQLPEQVLSDGGQFERSPMYHALAVEDMLDLVNLMATFRFREPRDWLLRPIPSMRRWLQAMSHPDGRIAFFNDAAFGVAPDNSELEDFARRLGLGPAEGPRDGVTLMEPSGYVRLQNERAVLIMDVGPIGPDYLPGHAHADTLSIELSVDGRRRIVNSGTSEYGDGAERARQRSTAAHSTVVVHGTDSSEVWGGFRVARRARALGLRTSEFGGALTASCAHDGYRRLDRRLDHFRTVTLSDSSLRVADRLGRDAPMQVRFHWAPGEQPPSGPVRIESSSGAVREERSTWHPEFGAVLPNVCTVVIPAGGESETVFSW